MHSSPFNAYYIKAEASKVLTFKSDRCAKEVTILDSGDNSLAGSGYLIEI